MPESSLAIADNIKNINEKVKTAAVKSGRDFSDITILAASKTRSPGEILEAFNCGIKVFGENYVQEFLSKFELLAGYKDLRWHIIGHLQKNKVKYITGKVDLIHSVDSVPLAKAVENRGVSQNIVTDILIEVNLAREKTKNGATIDETYNLVKEINKFQGLRLKGLMAMPPLEKNNRKYFKSLRELLKDINDKGIYKEKLSTLSMGTSGDFEAAIEEGATIIRLGTVIFGSRPPKAKSA